jgi:hypothetical protein
VTTIPPKVEAEVSVFAELLAVSVAEAVSVAVAALAEPAQTANKAAAEQAANH